MSHQDRRSRLMQHYRLGVLRSNPSHLGASPRSRRLRIEELEDRRMLAVVTVDTVDDVVDFNDDFTSLREAVFATNLLAGADEIQFDFGIDGPASLVLTEGELAITDALTIRGDGADLLTIDGNGNRIFNVDDGDLSTDAHFTVYGVTLTGGDAGRDHGGAIRSIEGLTIQSSKIMGNFADKRGGGIYVGSSQGEVTILNTAVADNYTRVGDGGGVFIHTDGNVTITGSILYDNKGEEGGGAYISSSGLITIIDNVISENLSKGTTAGGGGLFIYASGIVNIEGNTFTLNRTDGNRSAGGGLNIRGSGVFTIRGNTITDNRTDATSAEGGGLYVLGSGVLTISGNTITDNRTDGNGAEGGGAAIIFTGSATVSDNVIARNHSDGTSAEGGGIYIRPTGIAKITNNVITGNSTDGRDSGHGIYAYASNATVEISGNDVVGNTHPTGRSLGGIATRTTDTGVVVISDNTVTGNGGGIVVTGSGSTTVSRNFISENLEVGMVLSAFGGARIQTVQNTITNHTTERNGAGILVSLTESTPSSVSIVDTTVAGNESLNQGGGIYAVVRAGHTLEISRSTISGNTSARGGGGIWLNLSGGSALLEQVTVSGNSANESGGGIYLSPQFQNGTLEDEDLGELTIRHSTITQNTANPDRSIEEGGGGIYFGERALLSHTIVAGNEGGTSLADDIFGEFEGNFNLVGVGSETLGPLAHNGGFTQTHALLPGSPALDAGDPTITRNTEGVPEYDQRGILSRRLFFRRVIDQIDIGAYEAQTAPSADFDSDGDVDGSDFLTWQRGYGSTIAQRDDGNSDDDRDIDASDLAAWKVSFGQPQTPSAISSGQPELAADLIDAALAVEWLSRSEPIERDVPVLQVVIEPTVSPPAVPVDTMESVSRPAIVESGATSREPNQSGDHPWLSEELLEQVFG